MHGNTHTATQRQQAIQVEIESVGRRFLSSIAPHLRSRAQGAELRQQETRWHSLWIRSLEFLVIIEDCFKCPNHLNNKKETVAAAMRSSPQARKKVVRRRQRSKDVRLSPSSSTGCLTSSASKPRPWSFHAASEWTDWDYYQPPSFSFTPQEYKSSEDLHDENMVRSLIEFGENYEHWFRTDDGCVALRASTPVQDSQDMFAHRLCPPACRHVMQTSCQTSPPTSPPTRRDCKTIGIGTSNIGMTAGSDTDTGKSSGCCLSDGEESNYSAEELEHDREASSITTAASTQHHHRSLSPIPSVVHVIHSNPTIMTADASTECALLVETSSVADAATATVNTSGTMTTTDVGVQDDRDHHEVALVAKEVDVSPSCDALEVRRRRRPKSSVPYLICFAFSLVTLFVSIFFGDRPPHVQLSFMSPPPF